MADGWGAGTEIRQAATSFPEWRYVSGVDPHIYKRTVTDATELWVGMDFTNADNKKTSLESDADYTSVSRNYVGGGQFQVSGTKRIYGDWVQTYPVV
jgi:beta-xylosidase